MNLTNEQIQAILDGAPDDFTHIDLDDGEYEVYGDGARNLSDLREILTLRQEVELLKALNNGLKAPTARCSTRFICISCGKGGGSLLNIRPPQSYNCSHCENKNTMLPRHVYDAVKTQQSEVAARAVEDGLDWLNDNYPNACQPACGLLQQYANQLREQFK